MFIHLGIKNQAGCFNNMIDSNSIFLSPCVECIVKVCCSMICKDKEEYDKYLPTIEYIMEKYTRATLREWERNSFIYKIINGQIYRRR